MTDYLKKLGSLSVGSHMRRISESLSQDVADIYKQHNFEFEPKWFLVFRLLSEQSPITATEIADQLGVTHSAVNQIAQELIEHGYANSSQDKQDKRRQLLVFSNKGENLAEKLEPVWIKIQAAVDDLLQESGGQFLSSMYSLEACHSKRSLTKRVSEMSYNHEPVQIVRYEPGYRKHFADLNIEWLNKYFTVNKDDEKLLYNPDLVLATGGEVFFALCGKEVVGTVALIRQSADSYELAKMGVSSKYQGLGIGKKLINACINEARRRAAKVLTLEAVSILKASVHLYTKAGFVKYKPDKPSQFERVDTYMRLKL
jgi:DNA-binding MarR family transcriptional regulator/GNAT superfamily N-acetyltransferase